jgi:hypothetical protein
VARHKATARLPARRTGSGDPDAEQPRLPAPIRRPPIPPVASGPLRTEDLPALQAQVGNRAVVLAVQRQPTAGTPRYTRANRPKKGADVRGELRAHLPGLLGALTEAQLDHWQKVVDYYAITRHIDREIRELYTDFKSRYPGLEPGPQGMYAGFGPYNDAVAKIQAGRPKRPPGGDKLTVDPKLLMAEDARADPDWDVKAERAFREWATAELVKSPPVFDMYPEYDDEIISRRTALGSYTSKGVITLADLRHQFAAEYAARVTNRPEWQQLRTAFSETVAAYYDATQVHRERSDINKKNRGWFGVDVVRNIIEAVGEGDQAYPSIRQWDRPKALIDQAKPLLDGGKFELAVPILAMAELSTAQAADRIFAYDHRVETGAAVAVKWLGRVKTVGSVAAGIAAGPLGITGSALVAGGYTFVQEGAQNVSAMAHDQRTDLGLASLIKQAGMATVMGLMGGALQARFQAALSTRLAAMTGNAGGAVRDIATSSAAAMTSSVYTTAVESVLASVVEGTALPANATEFADLVVDKALQAGAMDVALRGPAARAAREYQSWRAGRAPVGAAHPATAGAKAADRGVEPSVKPPVPDPMQMPEDVAQRLLRDSGGWDRLSADLHAGTGLGHGVMPAERRALLTRFEASREALARDVAGMFQGAVSITDGGAGQSIQIRFTGDGADVRLAQAREYLDVRRPGWPSQTGMSLQAGAKAVAGPTAQKAIQALERATPGARKMAARLAPLYENWNGRNGEARLRLLVDVVNEQLRAAGVPDVHPAFGNKGAAEDGAMIPKTWELQIHADLLKGTHTPDQFAYLCGIAMHEGHHALQMFRAARTNPVLAKSRLDPRVFEAVMKANRGEIPAEKLRVDSLEYAEAAEVRESLWGTGRTHNKQTYTRLDKADAAYAKAVRNFAQVRELPAESPMRQIAIRDVVAARATRDSAHDDYMRLPEEVEAWRIGKETEAALKERLRLDAALTKARTAEREAHAAFNKVENPLLAELMDPGRKPSAAAVRAWENAMANHHRTLQVIQNILDRRHALATKGRPT